MLTVLWHQVKYTCSWVFLRLCSSLRVSQHSNSIMASADQRRPLCHPSICCWLFNAGFCQFYVKCYCDTSPLKLVKCPFRGLRDNLYMTRQLGFSLADFGSYFSISAPLCQSRILKPRSLDGRLSVMAEGGLWRKSPSCAACCRLCPVV